MNREKVFIACVLKLASRRHAVVMMRFIPVLIGGDMQKSVRRMLQRVIISTSRSHPQNALRLSFGRRLHKSSDQLRFFNWLLKINKNVILVYQRNQRTWHFFRSSPSGRPERLLANFNRRSIFYRQLQLTVNVKIQVAAAGDVIN